MNQHHAHPLQEHYTITDRAFIRRVDFDARKNFISKTSDDLLDTDRPTQFVRIDKANDMRRAIRLCALRRSEAQHAPAGSASNDAYTSLPKRQTGREAGTQSDGSLRDSRATEEAPSADEPSVTKSFGEGAVCGSF
jgi:hypothetical protein